VEAACDGVRVSLEEEDDDEALGKSDERAAKRADNGKTSE
jgi:hypothetical protein